MKEKTTKQTHALKDNMSTTKKTIHYPRKSKGKLIRNN